MNLNTPPIIGIPINTQVYMSAGDSKQTYFLNDEYAIWGEREKTDYLSSHRLAWTVMSLSGNCWLQIGQIT
ncbi:MAG: hypothetical protein ATN35_02540 [Epulopiscium sp. Nele67-Bin004]|nr:MAG: hypothetical protein ATN35_02540 [Epulopiscium sp. Nele67-Bin004]